MPVGRFSPCEKSPTGYRSRLDASRTSLAILGFGSSKTFAKRSEKSLTSDFSKILTLGRVNATPIPQSFEKRSEKSATSHFSKMKTNFLEVLHLSKVKSFQR